MSNYKDFCKKYKQKLKNDKDIKDNPKEGYEYFHDTRERIKFYVNVKETAPGFSILTTSGFYNGINLFELDDEDIEYLYNKYNKNLIEERDTKILKIKEEYDQLTK